MVEFPNLSAIVKDFAAKPIHTSPESIPEYARSKPIEVPEGEDALKKFGETEDGKLISQGRGFARDQDGKIIVDLSAKDAGKANGMTSGLYTRNRQLWQAAAANPKNTALIAAAILSGGAGATYLYGNHENKAGQQQGAQAVVKQLQGGAGAV